MRVIIATLFRQLNRRHVMKRKMIGVLVALMLLGSVGNTLAVNESRGGVMGFIAGCCFGIRAGAAYNDGKDIHWREWVMLIPYVNIVFAVWNGIDGANGVDSKDYVKKYGAAYY
jgi:hypothetical protein